MRSAEENRPFTSARVGPRTALDIGCHGTILAALVIGMVIAVRRSASEG